MGKNRRDYPTGRLRLRYYKNKYDSQKEYMVVYEYNWLKNAPIRKDSGVRCRVAHWDEKKCELTKDYGASYKYQNTLLKDTIKHFDSLLNQYNIEHPHQMNTAVIRNILNGAPITRRDGGMDFVEYVLEKASSRKTRNKIKTSRMKNHESSMHIFTEFLAAKGLGTYKPDAIYLGDISSELIDKYIDYRRDVKKNKDCTINHALTPIIQACKKAITKGLIDSKLAEEIDDWRIEEDAEYEEGKRSGKDYLTKEQLQQIVDFYNQDKEPRRKDYIEMFLFCFHCGGLRPIDMMSLAWDNVDFEKEQITKVLIKTSKGKLPRKTIPLNNAALEILRKWKEKKPNPKFVFDLLPENFVVKDSDELRKQRGSVEVKINQALKVVGEKIELPFTLTLKVARHSFAVLSLQNGMTMSWVSHMLGHSSTDTTEWYYAEYLPETLSEGLKKLDFNFLPNITSTE